MFDMMIYCILYYTLRLSKLGLCICGCIEPLQMNKQDCIDIYIDI